MWETMLLWIIGGGTLGRSIWNRFELHFVGKADKTSGQIRFPVFYAELV